MTVPRGLLFGLTLLLTVLLVGSVGYVVIEDMSFFDGFYMTLITISTVGFFEVGGPLSTTGRVLTVVVIIAGMGAALYTAFVGLEFFFEALVGGERRRRRMSALIDGMSDHVILCGFGRVGRTTWEELASHGADVVVIDSSEEKVTRAQELGAAVIHGNATHDDTLQRAGLARATVVIPAVGEDSDNLVITLSVKAVRPEVLVVARAVDEETERKLYLAGADRVVAPQLVGGQRLATLAMKPNLAEFIDLVVSGRTVEFQVEEIQVAAESSIVGKSLRELDLRRTAGALVLAVGDEPDRIGLNPDPEMVFKPGQIVIGIGTRKQLDALRTLTR